MSIVRNCEVICIKESAPHGQNPGQAPAETINRSSGIVKATQDCTHDLVKEDFGDAWNASFDQYNPKIDCTLLERISFTYAPHPSYENFSHTHERRWLSN